MQVGIAIVAAARAMQLFLFVIQPFMRAAELYVTGVRNVEAALFLLYKRLRRGALREAGQQEALRCERAKISMAFLLSTCGRKRVILRRNFAAYARKNRQRVVWKTENSRIIAFFLFCFLSPPPPPLPLTALKAIAVALWTYRRVALDGVNYRCTCAYCRGKDAAIRRRRLDSALCRLLSDAQAARSLDNEKAATKIASRRNSFCLENARQFSASMNSPAYRRSKATI